MSRGRPQFLLLIIFLLAANGLAFSVRQGMNKPPAIAAADPALVPLNFDGWQGREGELDQLSREMLKPDAYLVRDYFNAREGVINLTVLFGRSKSNFHSPALCLTGEGWSIIAKDKVLFPAGETGRPTNLTRLILQKDQRKMLVFYTFLSPGRSDSDWFIFQTRFLWERLQGRQPKGALVRLIVPVFFDERETEKTVRHFLKEISPSLHQFLSI